MTLLAIPEEGVAVTGDKLLNQAHPVAEVWEAPDVSEVYGEPDDGEEEVEVRVPRHATTVVFAGTVTLAFCDGVLIFGENGSYTMYGNSGARLRDFHYFSV